MFNFFLLLQSYSGQMNKTWVTNFSKLSFKFLIFEINVYFSKLAIEFRLWIHFPFDFLLEKQKLHLFFFFTWILMWYLQSHRKLLNTYYGIQSWESLSRLFDSVASLLFSSLCIRSNHLNLLTVSYYLVVSMQFASSFKENGLVKYLVLS